MICFTCKQDKPENEFSWRQKNIKRLTICKVCHSKYHKQHYQNNRQKYIHKASVIAKACKDKNRRNACAYLLTHPCVDCGETDIIVLEFDHRDGIDKDYNLGNIIGSSYSWKRILAEVAKCDVRCANCHRRRHAKASNSIRYQYQNQMIS